MSAYLRIAMAALIHGASQTVKMMPNVSVPATGCQALIEVDNEHKLCTFYEKPMPQKWLLMLQMKSGRIVWSQSVVGTTNEVTPWSRCLDPWESVLGVE